LGDRLTLGHARADTGVAALRDAPKVSRSPCRPPERQFRDVTVVESRSFLAAVSVRRRWAAFTARQRVAVASDGREKQSGRY
jgi:hypothetical protein